LVSCKSRIVSVQFSNNSINYTIHLEDTTFNGIDSIIKPYKSALDFRMNQVIGYCPKSIAKEKPSSALGNFLSDAIFETMKMEFEELDFVLLNYGGIRSTLDSGEITVRKIYEILPFENEFTILELNHKEFLDLIDLIKLKGGEPFSLELLNNVSKKKQSYFVGTSDYLANGGDGYSLFKDKKGYFRKNTGTRLRDALFLYFEIYDEVLLDFNERLL